MRTIPCLIISPSSGADARFARHAIGGRFAHGIRLIITSAPIFNLDGVFVAYSQRSMPPSAINKSAPCPASFGRAIILFSEYHEPEISREGRRVNIEAMLLKAYSTFSAHHRDAICQRLSLYAAWHILLSRIGGVARLYGRGVRHGKYSPNSSSRRLMKLFISHHAI